MWSGRLDTAMWKPPAALAALQDLADKLKRQEDAFGEEMQDVQEELKAIKMFLSRTMPDFKKQYPEILYINFHIYEVIHSS